MGALEGCTGGALGFAQCFGPLPLGLGDAVASPAHFADADADPHMQFRFGKEGRLQHQRNQESGVAVHHQRKAVAAIDIPIPRFGVPVAQGGFQGGYSTGGVGMPRADEVAG